jgi:aminoglycoside phosphotransferase (APT) family kinase protein
VGRVPSLAAPIGAVLAEIDRRHAAAPDRVARPLHGAPHKGQWLADGDRLALVDFDRFGLGDPESDVAVFEAEMEYEARAPAGLNARFRAGYETRGALDPALLRACRAGGHLAAARRFARATRRDAAGRAERAAALAAAELEA